jgi:hypothetical protein
MNPGVEKDYALDFLSVVRHVVTQMDGAAPAALSIGDMAKTYRHTVPSDLTRVRQHHGIGNGSDAVRFLIERAVAALGSQLAADDNGYRLAKPFESLRYERRKLHRFVETNEKDEERALRAAYNDLSEDRPFYVTVMGAKGGTKERGMRLHPLARAIPQISEKEFTELAADIKRNGVELPVVVWNGAVLDGRHRIAAAAALGVPVRVSEVDGDEARARARVLSLNVNRRHLTSAQRASIVRQLFLPDAREKAKERVERARKGKLEDQLASAKVREPKDLDKFESAKAAEIAVRESGGLATVRSVEALKDLDVAPQTQARVDKGEIKTVADARREARKERGLDPNERPPVVQPQSAWDRLGRALGEVKGACASIEAGHRGNVSNGQVIGRINEIRAHLDRAETLTHTHATFGR